MFVRSGLLQLARGSAVARCVSSSSSLRCLQLRALTTTAVASSSSSSSATCSPSPSSSPSSSSAAYRPLLLLRRSFSSDAAEAPVREREEYPPSATLHVPTAEELPLYNGRFVPLEQYVNGVDRKDPSWFSEAGRPRVPSVTRVEGESRQELVRRVLAMEPSGIQEEVYLREKELLRMRRLMRTKFYKKSQHPGLRKKLRRSMKPLKKEFLAIRDALHLQTLKERRAELNQPRIDVDAEARRRLDEAGIDYEPISVISFDSVAQHKFGI